MRWLGTERLSNEKQDRPLSGSRRVDACTSSRLALGTQGTAASRTVGSLAIGVTRGRQCELIAAVSLLQRQRRSHPTDDFIKAQPDAVYAWILAPSTRVM